METLALKVTTHAEGAKAKAEIVVTGKIDGPRTITTTAIRIIEGRTVAGDEGLSPGEARDLADVLYCAAQKAEELQAKVFAIVDDTRKAVR